VFLHRPTPHTEHESTDTYEERELTSNITAALLRCHTRVHAMYTQNLHHSVGDCLFKLLSLYTSIFICLICSSFVCVADAICMCHDTAVLAAALASCMPSSSSAVPEEALYASVLICNTCDQSRFASHSWHSTGQQLCCIPLSLLLLL
jgi:hypothetical protein